MQVAKVLVASMNDVKLKAAYNGFTAFKSKLVPMFDGINIVGIESKVENPDQPIGDELTKNCAERRAEGISSVEGFDFYVGIEGGVSWIGDDLYSFAWVCTIKDGKHGFARTSALMLPKEISNLIQAGHELGTADDIVFNMKDSKKSLGSVGILTHNIVNRPQLYGGAVLLSLIPFANSALFP